MAKEASLCLFFLSFLVITSCSGTLVGFSYRERGDAATISFLQRSKVLSPSQIRIFAADHRILSTLSNYTNVSVDFYLNKTLVQNFVTSTASYLVKFLPQLDIKSVIVSCGSECLSQNEVPSLVSALKSVHLVLSKFNLAREVKVSVAFPLSIFLENLNNASHKKDLSSILSFIKDINSYVMIEDRIDGQLSIGDHFFHSIVKRAVLAASVVPCKDVPLVVTIKSTVIPSSMELAQFSNRVSKYLEARTEMRERIVALYAELHESDETHDFAQKELKREEEEIFPLSRRVVLSRLSHQRRTLDNTPNSLNTVLPTNLASVTPIITPPDTPTIITVPSTTNPVTISPANPATMPVTIPSSTPVPLPPTNPATTPSGTVPGTQPATNPVTSYPPPSGSVPVLNPQPPPAATSGPPSSQGQSWCVAKTGAPESSLQAALDYACGMGGADCSQIQQSGSCYSPVTLQNHASFAFNSYYQKHAGPTSCDFGGTANLVNTNPSTGSCIFPSSSSAATSSSPATPTTPMLSPPSTLTLSISTPPPSPTNPPPSNPTTTTTPTPSIPTAPPTTSTSGSGTSGYGTPPSVLNSSNPASASGTMPGFGFQTPPDVNTTSSSNSVRQMPLVGYIVLMISFVAGRLSLRP